jgi:4-amino-4-deoxychorismate lyase
VIRVRDILVQNSLVNRKYLETIKAIDGRVQNLDYHQKRLEEVLFSSEYKKSYTLCNYVKPPKNGTYRCRVVYDEHDIEIAYIPYEKKSVQSLKIVYNDEIEYSKKYLNRDLLNELHLLKDMCDDVLIGKSGLITDTTVANIAFYNGVDWVTPKRPLLRGTTRQRYLENQKIIEQDIFVDDIKEFEKVALMNALIDFDIIAKDNIEEVIC